MKKWLSILGICGMISMSANLTACNKPDNNENGGDNKHDESWTPEQPPENSSWKIVDVSSKEKLKNELSNFNDKWYTVIWKPKNIYFIAKFNSKWDVLTPGGNISFQNYYVNFEYIKSLYHYDNSANEPELPEIDNNGKITDWKE
ncbi:spiroplasma phage ORF1-like family protein [Spiroplasma endosymbiont of Phyllotreta cruciferae]|uniref:spiroplasma phage ORF1-like family protein n=1 Tax=Spiroplasma endosymbiont of Phyllotreta cruciferae TaxID=2886375 RepID=UPI0020A045CB|nr:DUF3688 family protein [Spiroplasma endosymbiont of Phyllotreta cruciferae]